MEYNKKGAKYLKTKSEKVEKKVIFGIIDTSCEKKTNQSSQEILEGSSKEQELKIKCKDVIKMKEGNEEKQDIDHRTSKQIEKNDRFKHMKEFASKNNIQIVSELGSGGYGSVYLIKYQRKFFASKSSLSNIKGYSKNRIEKKKKEIENKLNVYLNLNHKYIVKSYDKYLEVKEKENYIYYNLIFEYAPCKSLYLFISFYFNDTFYHMTNRNEKFEWIYYISENLISFFILQICYALYYFNLNNFIHRDVKIDNILVMNDFSLRLSDFDTIEECTLGNKYKPYVTSLSSCGPECYLDVELAGEQMYKVDLFGIGKITEFLVFRGYFIKGIPYNDEKGINNDEMKYYKNLINKIDELHKEVDKLTKKENTTYNRQGNCKNKRISEGLSDFLKGLITKDVESRRNMTETLSNEWINSFNKENRDIYDKFDTDSRKNFIEHQKKEKLNKNRTRQIKAKFNITLKKG